MDRECLRRLEMLNQLKLTEDEKNMFTKQESVLQYLSILR